VDVGYGQVAERVRTDPRVVLLERTNLRHLQPEQVLGQKMDLATLDLSFISILKVRLARVIFTKDSAVKPKALLYSEWPQLAYLDLTRSACGAARLSKSDLAPPVSSVQCVKSFCTEGL
jgi:hypothetical protein